jgi:hypothetical protein
MHQRKLGQVAGLNDRMESVEGQLVGLNKNVGASRWQLGVGSE